MTSRKLRMAYFFGTSEISLDPGKIETIFQYEMIRNLYSRLVEYDENGQLVAGAPISFSWRDDSVTFVFGDKVKTVDGNPITARDAEVSLKRLIIQGKSGHGDIRRFLCPDHVLKSVSDSCPGVKVDGNNLVLTVPKAHLLPLLIATLESADYSIIPLKSLRQVDGTLSITDLRNTSGPYFINGNLSSGFFSLQANPHHYRFHSNMPSEVDIVPVEYYDGLKSLAKGDADLVPTTLAFTGEEAIRIASDSSFEIHETLPLQVRLVRFSHKALENFTPEQRLFAGLLVGQVFKKIAPAFRGQQAFQFFQALSDGALDETQAATIKELHENNNRPAFKHPIKLGVGTRLFKQFAEALNKFPEIQVIESKVMIASLPAEQRPDMYILTTDSAWTEDLALLGYNFKEGLFTLPGFDGESWFNEYLAQEDKAERIRHLNHLHFNMLKNASFVVTEVTPYHAAIRKPWRLNQSNLSAGTELWRLRIN